MKGSQQTLNILRNEVTAAIQTIVDAFRQGSDERGYLYLAQLMDPMEKLLGYASLVTDTEKIVHLKNNLLQALQAMEQGDPVMLADYLEYGVLPGIKEL